MTNFTGLKFAHSLVADMVCPKGCVQVGAQ
ncbi:hypothetical protein VCSRO29_2506 [Vibrio cholerae]|nr:hypothetical protein VCSRO29_2506 [Vibrio cholerae]